MAGITPAQIYQMITGIGDGFESSFKEARQRGLDDEAEGAASRLLNGGGSQSIKLADLETPQAPKPSYNASGRMPSFVAAQGGSPRQSLKTIDPVATGLAPHQVALLNGISAGESGGRYDIRYTPKGGATFADFGAHPGIFEPGPHGPSSAAGRYQFTKTTWDGLGGGDFSPENQDKRAVLLAQRDYKARTGRDLDEDLIAEGFSPRIQAALAPTWAALKGNQGRNSSVYSDTLTRVGGGTKAAAARPADTPARDAQESQGEFFQPGKSNGMPAAPTGFTQEEYRDLRLMMRSERTRGLATQIMQQRNGLAAEQRKRMYELLDRDEQRRFDALTRKQGWEREDRIRTENQSREDRIREDGFTRDDRIRADNQTREDRIRTDGWAREDQLTKEKRDYEATRPNVELFRDTDSGEIAAVDKNNVGAGVNVLRQGAAKQPKPEEVAGFRKEIQGLPSYKSYASALPAYSSMVDAAQRDDKAADLNMVYALAKIMDPTSVVREGEIQMANDTQGYADRLNGFINSIEGGSRLSSDARLGLLQEAQSRMQGFKGIFDKDRTFYEGALTRRGINIADVIPEYGDLPVIDPKRINTIRRDGSATEKPKADGPDKNGWVQRPNGLKIREKAN